jgi:hypothetical protein
MSFTLPNVFKQSKPRPSNQQKDRPSPPPSSPPRSRTLSMASVQSVATRMSSTFDRHQNWQNEQQSAASLDTDDLEDNPFFIAFKSLPHFHIFLRSALVCIPRSTSIVGLPINKRTLETHAFLPSPFYKGQFQSLDGKVVAIEKGYVTEVAGKIMVDELECVCDQSPFLQLIASSTTGFKQLRTIRIITEETHYTQQRKIRVLTIDRPLEGEIKVR